MMVFLGVVSALLLLGHSGQPRHPRQTSYSEATLAARCRTFCLVESHALRARPSGSSTSSKVRICSGSTVRLITAFRTKPIGTWSAFSTIRIATPRTSKLPIPTSIRVPGVNFRFATVATPIRGQAELLSKIRPCWNLKTVRPYRPRQKSRFN